uniref:Uncharacterized protein n=1 Tax=Gopherus agassizii TaxID=38772 RepID=A0A452GS84_9SAUR
MGGLQIALSLSLSCPSLPIASAPSVSAPCPSPHILLSSLPLPHTLGVLSQTLHLHQPQGVIAVGGNVTIRCHHQLLDMRILLYKNEDENYLNYTDPAGSEAEFPITSAEGGSNTCYYPPDTWSEPSNPMELVVGSEGLPRPNISLSPTAVTAPGADVTIRCQGLHRDVRFFLHKAGDLNPQQHMDRAGARAEFRIPTVGRQHGGNYSCSYRPRSEPFVSSQPSDPVQLVVAGEGPGSVSLLPALVEISLGGLLCGSPHLYPRVQSGKAFNLSW